MSTSGGRPATVSTANLLAGFQTFAATTAATTVVQVPAGRTWVGTVTVQCAAQEAAAGAVAAVATGIVSTAGVGVVPAAGTVLRCDALAGANAAGGLTGSQAEAEASTPLTVTAPAGNPVQIQAASTNAGTGSVVNVTAAGYLQ